MASTSSSPLASERWSASFVATASSAASASPQARPSSCSARSAREVSAGWGDSVNPANALFVVGSATPGAARGAWLLLGGPQVPAHAAKAPQHAAPRNAAYQRVTAIECAPAGRAKVQPSSGSRQPLRDKSCTSAALFLLS